ncbi:STAS domain-containing protein [Streptomyces sp. NBC_00878]|uniref:STAS domain-containing protein n=1 Tax=Streptomyces sp. NBC_00878 TaxID=2975854 RepID=UPI00224F7319|nr:STAS domain-containing protein [Streptomyces sp. NBC_00878]MCX4910549.1 STAS domain-containing protein [Streptomyces sp. NBC_00878]
MPDFSPAWQPAGPPPPLGVGSRLRHPFRGRRLRTEITGDRAVVHLSGEITSGYARRLGTDLAELLRSEIALLVIDLGKVTYLSSDGAGMIFIALRAARSHGTRVIATHVGPQSRATLEQLGLLRIVDVYAGDGPNLSQGTGE